MSSSANYEFYSKENMKLIISIFSGYMNDKHFIDINTIEDPKTLKKVVYAKMNDVYEKHGSSGKRFQELNVIVLTSLKDHYLEKSRELEAKKPNLVSLNRDAMVFGKRQININELIPESTPYTKRDQQISGLSLDKLIHERERQVNGNTVIPDISKLGPQIVEKPEDTNDFQKRLAALQQDRESAFDSNAQLPSQPPNFQEPPLSQDLVMNRMILDDQTIKMNSIENHDPKAFFTTPFTPELVGKDTKPFTTTMTTPDNVDAPFWAGDKFLNPRNKSHKEVKKYISINSVDRTWGIDKLRYRYTINSLSENNDLQKRYRNITSIRVGKVVIPEEIIQVSSTTYQNVKQSFNFDFSFGYPYIILNIAEFEDVYDGTNNNVRKAFSKLIFHQYYKAPNGRGFIVLEPIQKEKKTFYPNPLSSFGNLSVSLLKPNGDLFNTSSDSYQIFKVEYEAFNPHYLKIVTDVYFDKNEFYVGDDVIFQGHQMTNLDEAMDNSYTQEFNAFINRPHGHEVKQIGSANDSGYFRTFYIQAPGAFDKVNGRFEVNQTLISHLSMYNAQIDWCSDATPTNGRILNSSLQHTISLTVEMLVDDAKIIDRQIL